MTKKYSSFEKILHNFPKKKYEDDDNYISHEEITSDVIGLNLEEMKEDIKRFNENWKILLRDYKKGYREGFLRGLSAMIFDLCRDFCAIDSNYRFLQPEYFRKREYVINNTLCLQNRKVYREKILRECKQIAIEQYLEELRQNNGKFEKDDIC